MVIRVALICRRRRFWKESPASELQGKRRHFRVAFYTCSVQSIRLDLFFAWVRCFEQAITQRSYSTKATNPRSLSASEVILTLTLNRLAAGSLVVLQKYSVSWRTGQFIKDWLVFFFCFVYLCVISAHSGKPCTIFHYLSNEETIFPEKFSTLHKRQSICVLIHFMQCKQNLRFRVTGLKALYIFRHMRAFKMESFAVYL